MDIVDWAMRGMLGRPMVCRSRMVNWSSMVDRSAMIHRIIMVDRSMVDRSSMVNWSIMVDWSMVYRSSMVNWSSIMGRGVSRSLAMWGGIGIVVSLARVSDIRDIAGVLIHVVGHRLGQRQKYRVS